MYDAFCFIIANGKHYLLYLTLLRYGAVPSESELFETEIDEAVAKEAVSAFTTAALVPSVAVAAVTSSVALVLPTKFFSNVLVLPGLTVVASGVVGSKQFDI